MMMSLSMSSYQEGAAYSLFSQLALSVAVSLMPWHPLVHRCPGRAAAAGSAGCHPAAGRREQGRPADASVLPQGRGQLGGRESDDTQEPGCVSGPISLSSQFIEERKLPQVGFPQQQ